MQLKALITTVILGSSSVALADTQIRDHRYDTRVDVRADVRADARVGLYQPIRHVRPAPLTYVTLANNLALDGRAVIKLQPTKRQFNKLELRAQGNGRTSIDKVVVVFGNGRSQTIDLDAKLNARKQGAISIDLKGDSRNIERVVLVGKSNGRRASLDVLAI